MELVENKSYYHIQRLVTYNSNNLFHLNHNYFIGKQKNPFFEMFDYNAGDINHYIMLTRELIFEEVRRDNFSIFPSRTKCLWVIEDNQENLDYWRNELIQEGVRYRLLKMSLTGKIYKANQHHLRIENVPLEVWRQKAFKYWSGASGSSDNETEILFEGFASVIDIIEERV